MLKMPISPLPFFLILLLGTTTAQADPKEELRETVNSVLVELYREVPATPEERKATLRTIITTRFNFEAIARRALGRNWNRFDEKEQARFVQLFTTLLIETYADRYDGKIRPEVEWGDSIELARNRMEVHSKVILDGQAYSVIYRLAILENRWQVYDVIIEGVSLVGNYRQQFDSVLSNGTPAELLQTLTEKVQ